MDQVILSTPTGLYTVDADTGNISGQMNDTNASLICPVGTIGQGGVTGTRIICCPQTSKGLLHYWRLNAITGVAESSGNPVYKCSAPEKFTALSFSSCGGLMFAGSATGTMYVWQTWTGSLLKSWTGHFGSITCIRVSIDDCYVFTSSEDSTIKSYFLPDVFDSKSPVPIPMHTYSAHSASVVDMLIKGTHLVSISKDKSVKIFDWKKTSTQSAHFVLPSEPVKVTSNNNLGEVYVGLIDGSVHACNMESGLVEPMLSVHTSAVTGIAITIDGARLITCAATDGVKIWDIHSRVVVQSIMGPSQQLKGSAALLMMRKVPHLPDGILNENSRQVGNAIDQYLQFKPLQRTLTPVESIDTVPLIRAPNTLSKVKNGFTLNAENVSNSSLSREDAMEKLEAELAKQKELVRVWVTACSDLYTRLSAVNTDEDVELAIPMPNVSNVDSPEGSKRKKARK